MRLQLTMKVTKREEGVDLGPWDEKTRNYGPATDGNTEVTLTSGQSLEAGGKAAMLGRTLVVQEAHLRLYVPHDATGFELGSEYEVEIKPVALLAKDGVDDKFQPPLCDDGKGGMQECEHTRPPLRFSPDSADYVFNPSDPTNTGMDRDNITATRALGMGTVPCWNCGHGVIEGTFSSPEPNPGDHQQRGWIHAQTGIGLFCPPYIDKETGQLKQTVAEPLPDGETVRLQR